MIENVDVNIENNVTNIDIVEVSPVSFETINLTQYWPSDTYLRAEIDQKFNDLDIWYVAQW